MITAKYFSEGDRILATVSPENKDTMMSMVHQVGTIHEFEVGEHTYSGFLKLRYVAGSGERGHWFWLTDEGKNAQGGQIYNFIDVIYAPIKKTTDDCYTGAELKNSVAVNWPEANTKAKEPVTLEGQFKIITPTTDDIKAELVKTVTGLGAQCDEEVSSITMHFDHSLENRIQL